MDAANAVKASQIRAGINNVSKSKKLKASEPRVNAEMLDLILRNEKVKKKKPNNLMKSKSTSNNS